jgi:hypothetical protein
MSNESKVVAQHTPGPWELMERGAYGDFDGRSQIIMSEPLSGDNPFRLAAVHVDNMDDVAGAANARLMAAAPELLEALTELLDAESAEFPAYESGKAAQEAWGWRRTFAKERAHNLIKSLSTGEGAAMKEQKT